MAKKRAVMGFKGITLAPVTKNDLAGYTSSDASPLLYAGSMTKTAKETSLDVFYDDDLYMQVKDISGEEVELRVAEVPLSQMAALGLGTFDEDTNLLEADFNVSGLEFALRFVVDTVSHLPFYFNYRLFQLTSLKFDNFQTKGSNAAVAEVILTGVLKRPSYSSLKPYAIMQLADDKSNQDECQTFLLEGEQYPS